MQDGKNAITYMFCPLQIKQKPANGLKINPNAGIYIFIYAAWCAKYAQASLLKEAAVIFFLYFKYVNKRQEKSR